MLRPALLAVLLAAAASLSGCGAVTVAVGTATSVTTSAIGAAGDAVAATADLATAPFRSGDEDEEKPEGE
jgi:hypothetical protein